MRQFLTVFIVVIILCVLISCEKDEKIDMTTMKDILTNIIDSHIYKGETYREHEVIITKIIIPFIIPPC